MPDRYKTRALRAAGLALAGAAMLLAGACASTTCDPREGGFISGVGCMSSGGYKQRIEELQAARDAETREQVAAEDRANAARARVEERQARVAVLRDQLAALDRETAQNEALARSLRAGNADQAARNKALTAELASKRQQLTALQKKLNADPQSREYEAVRQEYLSVQNALRTINQRLAEEQKRRR